VSTIFTDTNQYRVILEGRPGLLSQSEQSWLLNCPLRLGTHPTVRLRRIKEAQTRLCRLRTLPSIRRRRSASDTRPHVSLGSAVEAIRATARRSVWPSSITLSFVGASLAYQNSLANELWLTCGIGVCLYRARVLYESYIHPLTICPLCLRGCRPRYSP